MKTFKFSGQINVVFSEVEIDAESLEEAQAEFDSLSTKELLEQIIKFGCVDDSEIIELETEVPDDDEDEEDEPEDAGWEHYNA